MKNQNEKIKFFILITILVAGTLLFWEPLYDAFSEQEKIKKTVTEVGFLGPILFTLLAILQVILAPIPGQLTGIAGGFLFGAFWGTVYSMLGILIGSFIVFYFSRKLGRPFVEKIIEKKKLNHWHEKIEAGGIPILFTIFLLPIFPDDLICYIAGLTRLKIKNLMLVAFFGRLPSHIVLSIIGAGSDYKNPWIMGIIASYVLLVIITYVNRKEIEKLIFKKSK
jgi:uncharacterized membrane protein YdjX (TVP38/TMEM64 family)